MEESLQDSIKKLAQTQDVQTKESKKHYSWDDTGTRDRFIDHYGDIFLYDAEKKNVYFYSNGVWKLDKAMKLSKYFDYIVEDISKTPIIIPQDANVNEEKSIKKAFDKFLKRCRNHAGKVAGMEEIKARVAIDVDRFDMNMSLLNAPDGTIDLNTFKVSPHNSNSLLSKIAHGSLDTDATAPLWNEFLGQTFLGDQEMINFVQRAIGYTVLGVNNNRSFFILHGTGEDDGNGSNGKSVFVQTIANVLGDYGIKMSPDSFTARKYDKDGSAPSPDMMRLDKARFVYTSELKKESRLNESLIKDITGGEDIVARPLYGDNKQFKPTGVVWLTTNYKPIIEGTDGAIWERLKFIPFEAYIPVEQQDHNLVEKLTQEADGIMNWIIEGAKNYVKDGLNIPDSINQNNNSYRKELDVVQMFIDDNIVEVDPSLKRKTFISDIRSRYVSWKDKANVSMSVRDFSKKFNEHYKQSRYQSYGKYAFHDIKLNFSD